MITKGCVKENGARKTDKTKDCIKATSDLHSVKEQDACATLIGADEGEQGRL